MTMLDTDRIKSLAIEIAAAMPPAPPTDPAEYGLGLPYVELSARAQAIFRIAEIVNMRGWQTEVTRTLYRHSAACVEDLDTDALYALRDRMEYFEDCAQTMCDPDGAPPAR
jgi:hypothetical protein